jgi:hypothetical protein
MRLNSVDQYNVFISPEYKLFCLNGNFSLHLSGNRLKTMSNSSHIFVYLEISLAWTFI